MKTKEEIYEEAMDKVRSLVPIEDSNIVNANEYDEIILEAMDSYAEQMAIGFNDWKEKLSPSQLVTVHPPAGSGGTHGIYDLSTKELYQLYLKSIEK